MGVLLWYSDSAQIEGMGGQILGWGVFDPFRNLTTDSSMGTVPIGLPVEKFLTSATELHYITHGLALLCRRRSSHSSSNVSSLLLHHPKPSTLKISLTIHLELLWFLI